MPDRIPNGWIETTLGEIVRPSRERVLPRDYPEARYIGLEHIESQSMRLLGHGYARDARSSSLRFSKGAVLYGRMRPYLNKVWVAEFDGLCSAEFLVFRKRDGLESWFLALRLNAEDFVTFANEQVSGERPRVNFEKLSRFTIVLPPTAQQEKIVATFRSALLRVARAETAIRRARERIQRYRESVLKAAVTGELTRVWRDDQLRDKPINGGEYLLQQLLDSRYQRWQEAELQRLRANREEPENVKWKLRYPKPVSLNVLELPDQPKGWIWVSIDQLASGQPGAIQSGPFGSQLLHSEFVDEGILVIGIDNVLDGIFSLGREHRITPLKYERLKKFSARPLDVVVTVMATVGRVCVLPTNLEPAIITKHCYRITPAKDWVNSDFLSFALRADAPTRRHLFGNVRGQTRPGINGTILKSAPVALPPLNEQSKIVREVKDRLSAAARLAKVLDQQLANGRVARQSLLRQAFIGILVAQDPEAESASLLTERLRAANKVDASKTRGKGMQKSIPRSKISRRPLIDVLHQTITPITPEQLFRDAGFEPSQVDEFYRELVSLRAKLRELRPQASETREWPGRAGVYLQLKKGSEE